MSSNVEYGPRGSGRPARTERVEALAGSRDWAKLAQARSKALQDRLACPADRIMLATSYSCWVRVRMQRPVRV